MSQNFLKLNENKTEFIVFGTTVQLSKLKLSTLAVGDSSKDTKEIIVHAFVTTRLDYLNSLLYGMPDYIIKRLQRLLNAAARIITNLGKYDHITDAMKKLHWLPIESRIQYKVLVLVHACVHNIAPPFLSSLLTSYVPSREMRSSGKLIIHQPIPNMVTYGKRSFAYGGPRLWNNLDIKLRPRVSPEQAGFRPGKSCTSQLLNLTQHIEDGYQRGMITGAAFVDLSAAYDTVNHRILIQKLYNTTQDSQLCRVFQNMLSNRRFYVELNNERSRWRKQKNGLPQGSVLSPILFNIYTNDQPIHDGTRNFIYADDLCVTAQYSSFTEVETTMHRTHTLLQSRIQYKVLVLVHACVHNIAPPFLSSLLTSYVPSREMRSSGKLIIHQPIPNMVTYGKRSFAYGGPRLWNNLDIKLRLEQESHQRLSNGN